MNRKGGLNQKRQPKNDTFVSDVLVDVMKAIGIEYASFNPGASIRGLHDSIVNYGGNRSPELILCCHEGIAVSMASGYYRATGKPMVVMLHDLEGLLHGTKAIFNAWLERDPMILIGGNGPMDVERRRPGIDWRHTALVPNLVLRNFVKWDDQPQGMVSTVEALIRAYLLTMSEPTGPVYLSIDADLQEQRLATRIKIPPIESFHTVTIGEGSLSAIESTADLLINAENPVIIVDCYGRDNASVETLVKFAEKIGAPVVDTGSRFNFPSDHPLNLTGMDEEMLSDADVVLALGVKDLHEAITKEEGPHYARLSKYAVKPDCKVIRIDMETILNNNWVSDYGRLTPTTQSVVAYPPSAVSRMLALASRTSKGAERIRERKAKLAGRSKSLRIRWLRRAKEQMNERPIALSSLALVSWQLVSGKDWVLTFPSYSSVGMNAWLRRIWEITKYDQYPGRGGGTGVGIGRALGASIANRGRLCIDFQPDGDLLYVPSALWTAAHSKIPLLIVMLNNRSYYNDEEHQRAIALLRGRPVENSKIGIRIENPNVDFAHLAKSFGIQSSGPVENIESLKNAMKKGISVVMDERNPFLIDAVVQPR